VVSLSEASDLEITPEDKELLFDLVHHPAWPVVKRIAKQNADRRADGLAKILLHTDTEIDLGKLQYDRGYWKAVTDFPGRIERQAKQREE